ncbi:AGAP011420-PA, partial [Anopheles gambiae str. PEST]
LGSGSRGSEKSSLLSGSGGSSALSAGGDSNNNHQQHHGGSGSASVLSDTTAAGSGSNVSGGSSKKRTIVLVGDGRSRVRRVVRTQTRQITVVSYSGRKKETETHTSHHATIVSFSKNQRHTVGRSFTVELEPSKQRGKAYSSVCIASFFIGNFPYADHSSVGVR